MSDAFFKFPSTPHLDWLGNGKIRGDKVFTDTERLAFLSESLVIEEKVDGANLGLSISDSGELRFQNRGNWLSGKLTGQWQSLRGWTALHESNIRNHLPIGCTLFGEWCAAKHSIQYDALSDWFLGFDVFETKTLQFWSTQRRNQLLRDIGLQIVPQFEAGHFSYPQIQQMLNRQSSFAKQRKIEGLYLRHENKDFLVQRAKLVNPDFTQNIEAHWSTQRIVKNLTQTRFTSRISNEV